MPKSISTGGSPTKRYLQKLRKLQTAMLEIEEIYRVERRRGIVALEGLGDRPTGPEVKKE